jgi:hypothetical protein
MAAVRRCNATPRKIGAVQTSFSAFAPASRAHLGADARARHKALPRRRVERFTLFVGAALANNVSLPRCRPNALAPNQKPPDKPGQLRVKVEQDRRASHVANQFYLATANQCRKPRVQRSQIYPNHG